MQQLKQSGGVSSLTREFQRSRDRLPVIQNLAATNKITMPSYAQTRIEICEKPATHRTWTTVVDRDIYAVSEYVDGITQHMQ